MKKRLTTIAALALLALPGICAAISDRPGGYVSGFLGVSIPRNTDVTNSDFISNETFDDLMEFDPGINVGGATGYDFGIMRMECELSYKYSEIKSITDQTDGFRFRSVSGNLGAFATMFNLFHDLHNDSPFTPYWGGGIGFAVLHLSDTYGTDIISGVQQRILLYSADDATVFAYQAGAGLEIALNPQLSLDLGYRYFGTAKARFDSDLRSMTEMKLESHNAVIGIRMKF
ncbi:MAG: outer membrane beta-barrel protein [Geobacteraceae bacterium]